MMKISPSVLGLIRGLGYPMLMLVIAYFSTTNNVASLGVSLGVATAISALLSSLEHFLEAQGKGALFGAVHAY